MQLKVLKIDGTTEEYLHTKVLGTISNALANTGEDCGFVAEQLSEAITFYLYRKHTEGTVSSSEIYFMIQAMLTATGNDQAAVTLHTYHFMRELTRKRVEVAADMHAPHVYPDHLASWNKSQIAADLIAKGINRNTARAIAAMTEEKILRLGMSRIPRSLIKQIVEIESHALLAAQNELTGFESKQKRNLNSESHDHMGKLQKGLCTLAV